MLKKLLVLVAVVLFVAPLARASWFLDFEWGLGHDQEWIGSGIPGIDFDNQMFYADANTGNWNFSNDLGNSWGGGEFWIGGYVGAHAKSDGIARINFNNADASWFSTGYCSAVTFYLEAYDISDNLLNVASGPGNTRYYNGNPDGLYYLTVTSPSNNIAYVILHDYGYGWVADNMSGDASGVGNPIPEPGTLLLLGTGLLGLGAFRLRRK